MIKFIKNKRLASASLFTLLMMGTIGTSPAISSAFRFSDFTFKRSNRYKTKFHNTTYGNGQKGVNAFQQFVYKESQALNLSQLNARKLDATKLQIKYDINNLKIYFVNEGAGYRNQLKLVTSGTTKKDGFVFIDGSKGNRSTELRLGDFIEVGQIKSGTTLDFQLRANGYNKNRNVNKPDSQVHTWYLDVPRNTDGLQHVIAYEYEGYLILGWEDLNNGGDKDYNDIVFAIDLGQKNLDEIPNQPPVNQAPSAQPDNTNTSGGQSISIPVTNNDTDPEGHNITIQSVDTLLTEGTVSVSNDKKKVIYTPKPGYVGSDSFVYTAIDSLGQTDTAIVSIDVAAPPKANNDRAETPNDQSVIIDVLKNDDNPENDTLTITASNPANGTIKVENGKVVYTPDSNYKKGKDSFSYTIEDSLGSTSTATVDVNVTEPNGAPIAAEDNPTTSGNVAITIDVLKNDSDPENGELEIKDVTASGVTVTNSATGTTSTTLITSNGSVVITQVVTNGQSDDQVVYTPNPDFEGTDSFTYTVVDPAGNTDQATVNVTVSPIVYAD